MRLSKEKPRVTRGTFEQPLSIPWQTRLSAVASPGNTDTWPYYISAQWQEINYFQTHNETSLMQLRPRMGAAEVIGVFIEVRFIRSKDGRVIYISIDIDANMTHLPWAHTKLSEVNIPVGTTIAQYEKWLRHLGFVVHSESHTI